MQVCIKVAQTKEKYPAKVQNVIEENLCQTELIIALIKTQILYALFETTQALALHVMGYSRRDSLGCLYNDR